MELKNRVEPEIRQWRIKAGSTGLIRPDIRHPERYCRIIRQYPVRHAGNPSTVKKNQIRLNPSRNQIFPTLRCIRARWQSSRRRRAPPPRCAAPRSAGRSWWPSGWRTAGPGTHTPIIQSVFRIRIIFDADPDQSKNRLFPLPPDPDLSWVKTRRSGSETLDSTIYAERLGLKILFNLSFRNGNWKEWRFKRKDWTISWFFPVIINLRNT